MCPGDERAVRWRGFGGVGDLHPFDGGGARELCCCPVESRSSIFISAIKSTFVSVSFISDIFVLNLHKLKQKLFFLFRFYFFQSTITVAGVGWQLDASIWETQRRKWNSGWAFGDDFVAVAYINPPSRCLTLHAGAARTRRRPSHVFSGSAHAAMLKLNTSSAEHLFSSSLIVLKRYPPRRAVRSCRLEVDVLF